MAEADEVSVPPSGAAHTPTAEGPWAGRLAARWTHLALPCADLDASVAFYTAMTPLEVVHRHGGADGRTVWLAEAAPRGAEGAEPHPFVLVLVEAAAGTSPGAVPAPFAHLGMELAARRDVEEVAARGRASGCLHWEPVDLPEPVGYVCALRDPDGNVVEFSHGQDVAARVRRRRAAAAAGEGGRRRGWASDAGQAAR